ncbi:cytochrome c class I [Segniliparus rotundus DSM 44985]|uniref:Cytochrome bc1 complex cytochrome c subunit n=1 Tax=Segniliparus rotundus (strain ATCC BAA-972 / CDC 1076 / CIP 108378 / DSM 44985 / JCM 13578) TaxID=640132 RepID=D6ZF09_SEGRD|nr:cytochrome c [Segniliparus rotundus]ADG97533.1 cytochrome c class I [Segniliparus rotundus DSM 44985]
MKLFHQHSSDGDAPRKAGKFRRRARTAAVLFSGLVAAGFATTLLTPHAQVAKADEKDLSLIRDGKQLYETSCITCHGANLEGIAGQGPSLIGVGNAAVYFQVSSGRMPAARNEAQIRRKQSDWDEKQIEAVGAYIDSYGEGPSVVYEKNPDGSVKLDADGNKVLAQESLRGKDPDSVARGGELFRMNCASCHNYTGRGGALSSGKFAPPLDAPNEQQIYAAMLTGPQNMPKFSDGQLSPEAKKDIIAYIKTATETNAQGGYSLGGFGPVSEGAAMAFVGVVAILGLAMWIGSRT